MVSFALLSSCAQSGGGDELTPIIGSEFGETIIIETPESKSGNSQDSMPPETLLPEVVEVTERFEPLPTPDFPKPDERRFVVKSEDSSLLADEIIALGGEIQIVFELGDQKYFLVSESLADKLLSDSSIAGLKVAEATNLVRDTSESVTARQSDAPWNLDILDGTTSSRLNNTYNYSSDGRGVPVYIVDSGVSPTGDFLLSSGFTPYGLDTDDCAGHGTHVAGIVGSTSFGVAKGATIVPIKVFWNEFANCESTTDYYLALAINWIINNHPVGPGVINMSLGGIASNESFLLEDVIAFAKSKGLVVVAAAGNEGVDACNTTPARVANLAVGASTPSDSRAEFSNYGRCVHVYAPGTEIESNSRNGGSVFLNGTSMAAPHVSGLVARLISAGNSDPVATIRRLSLPLISGSNAGEPGKVVSLIEVSAPGAPAYLSAYLNQNTVLLEWSKVPNATRYQVEGRSSSNATWLLLSDTTTGEQFRVNISRGTRSTRLDFRVMAINEYGKSPFVTASLDVPATETATTSTLPPTTSTTVPKTATTSTLPPTTSTTVPKTTTTSTTTTTTTVPKTTTTTNQTPTLDSDSLSKSSMVLQSNIGSNSVYWTVRVRDPFGGRLNGNAVGARLCPTTSSWPDGAGCTGATAYGQGNNVDRTYTFFFLISPDAPTGQWLGRIFGPVSNQPDIIGLSRITVTR
jgi:subtilisin family serine protease